jgi:hypothetical protein
VTYSAYDETTAETGGTIDIDGDGTTYASTGASTATIGPILPIGVVPQPLYASYLSSRYTNYSRNTETVQFLVQNQAILIPAISAREQAIEIGDVVCLDDTASPTHNPLLTTGGIPGRLMPLSDTTTADVAALKAKSEYIVGRCIDRSEYIVGRCIDRFPIAKQSSTSQNQTYRAALLADNVDVDEVSKSWGFHSMRLVQTVPGLGLPGSGTLGVPGYLTFSTADASGYFWGLVIVVQAA